MRHLAIALFAIAACGTPEPKETPAPKPGSALRHGCRELADYRCAAEDRADPPFAPLACSIACDRGDAAACAHVAVMKGDGEGPALEPLRSACALGVPVACETLSRRGEDERRWAAEQLEVACERAHATHDHPECACTQWAHALSVQTDAASRARSIDVSRTACDAGSSEACELFEWQQAFCLENADADECQPFLTRTLSAAARQVAPVLGCWRGTALVCVDAQRYAIDDGDGIDRGTVLEWSNAGEPVRRYRARLDEGSLVIAPAIGTLEIRSGGSVLETHVLRLRGDDLAFALQHFGW